MPHWFICNLCSKAFDTMDDFESQIQNRQISAITSRWWMYLKILIIPKITILNEQWEKKHRASSTNW